MKGDDGEPRAGPQPRDRNLEKTIEAVELAVDPDPERLKRPRRGIDAGVATPWNRAPHDGGKLRRAGDRRLASRLDQRAGDAPREPLFAVAEDRVGELDFGRMRDEIGRRLALRTVHAHVERFVALETEAAARCVELHRRDTEVSERAVDHGNLALVKDIGDRAVVGVDELDAFAPRCERFGGAGESVAVAIESDEPRRPGLEQRAGVAAEADRAVDEEAAVFGTEELQDLGGHDRHVRHQIPNSASARASSSVYGSRCSLARKRS